MPNSLRKKAMIVTVFLISFPYPHTLIPARRHWIWEWVGGEVPWGKCCHHMSSLQLQMCSFCRLSYHSIWYKLQSRADVTGGANFRMHLTHPTDSSEHLVQLTFTEYTEAGWIAHHHYHFGKIVAHCVVFGLAEQFLCTS